MVTPILRLDLEGGVLDVEIVGEAGAEGVERRRGRRPPDQPGGRLCAAGTGHIATLFSPER